MSHVRARAGLALLLTSLLAAGMHAAVAQAQQRTTAKEPPAAAARAPARATARFVPTAWQVRCVAAGEKKGAVTCVLGRAIVEARTRQILVRVEIPDHRKFMALQLPHGLDLRQPAQVLVNDKPLGKAVFITSRPTGAFARLPLTAKALNAMRKGKSLSVKMKIFNGRDMAVRMDLKGFAAALKKLR